MNELLKIELDEAVEISTEERERYKIKDLDSANWAFRKLSSIESKRKEIEELSKAEIERINSWKDSEFKHLDNSKEFFEFLLTEYFIEQRKLDPKFKVSTPYGKVSSRKQQPKWNYNEDKLVEWLKENKEDFLKVKYEADKSGLKKVASIVNGKAITEDGEIVEGIVVEERPDTITIKVVE